MQFCDAGPDVPDELIRAQLAGDVVLVIGAGVSQRVGLPSFAQLVANVYERLGQACPGTADSLADIAEVDAWSRQEWDRTLALLEQRLVYPNPNRPEATSIVRQSVAEILAPPRGRSVTHQDILQISRDGFGRPRVVTTNFDTLFERAWRTSRPDPLVSSVGPGLPAVGSSDFQGVIHLHGRIADARLRLGASSVVLTSGDFGEAYLRSGWASRFVYDLLRRYTLVFVGYSADDPPMRYMLEATEAGRLHFPDLRRAYAFASFGDDTDSDEGSVRARWRAKGLVPIPYENGDGCYDNLYDTLSAWAACTRDPAGWAEAEIGRLVAVPFSDASTAVQKKVTFLTTALASTTVLSSRAAFFDWVDCLIDTQSSPPLSDRDALIWLEHRLADRDLVRWAIEAAGSIKAVIARAAAMHLAIPKQPVPDLFRKYWRVYAATYSDRSPGNQFDWLEVRRRATGTLDYFTIEAVTQLVRPRLQLGRAWPGFGDLVGEGETEPSLQDLCTVNFECADWPSWTELLGNWPNEADAEYRLLNALGRVLAQACELAREAGFIRPDWDGASRAVQLVHALEPAEAEIPTRDEGFRGDHWQPTDSDQHDHSFVPIVRLMSGLWRRLVEHASDRASSIARSWIDEEAKLFRRLGYWAATISEHGPIDRGAELLAKVSRETFWIEERSAEGARFWCGRWNSLPPKTRRTLEANILRGPQGEWMWLAEDKRRATDFARHRELARIATAGGRLSARAQRAFTRLAARLENPPVQVSVVEGLRQRSWSGWGRRGDISLVAETPDERLLEHVDEIEGRDPINQSGLWAAVCGDMPDKAFAALIQARARGQWPAARWQEFLNRSRMEFGKGINTAQVTVVAEALGGMPEDVLRAITPSFGGWLKSLSSVDLTAEMRPVVLSSWDRLLVAVERLPEEERQRPSGQRDLSHESLNHPVGDLANVLITLQDKSPKEQGAGLAIDLAPRFAQLLRLPAPIRLLALTPMVQALLFFMWLAPAWAEENLCRELDRNDADAMQLLSMMALYGQFYNIGLFNRLKPLICGALVRSETPSDARDRLALFVTWAIGCKMAGDDNVDLSEPEARRLLTRSPPSALRSIAWSLWRSLDKPEEMEQRDLWTDHIKPFLERVWPNDVVARDPNVSKMLIKIPAATAAQLPEAVTMVVRLIVPMPVHSVFFDFDIDAKPDLLREFPGELLDLAHASIDLKEALPYDLPKFLDAVLEAAPDLRDDARYAALRNAVQRE